MSAALAEVEDSRVYAGPAGMLLAIHPHFLNEIGVFVQHF
jgi:hypothetical protein